MSSVPESLPLPHTNPDIYLSCIRFWSYHWVYVTTVIKNRLVCIWPRAGPTSGLVNWYLWTNAHSNAANKTCFLSFCRHTQGFSQWQHKAKYYTICLEVELHISCARFTSRSARLDIFSLFSFPPRSCFLYSFKHATICTPTHPITH